MKRYFFSWQETKCSSVRSTPSIRRVRTKIHVSCPDSGTGVRECSFISCLLYLPELAQRQDQGLSLALETGRTDKSGLSSQKSRSVPWEHRCGSWGRGGRGRLAAARCRAVTLQVPLAHGRIWLEFRIGLDELHRDWSQSE